MHGVSPHAVAPSAQDWPQWRGPARDGAIAAFKEPATWPAALTKRWQVDVGCRLCHAARRRRSRLRLLAPGRGRGADRARRGHRPGSSGARPIPPAFTMNPATRQHGPGPKSTPTYADGRLFTLGMTGVGARLRRARRPRAVAGARAGRCSRSTTPRCRRSSTATSVIVHVGGQDQGALTAFDVATGKVALAMDRRRPRLRIADRRHARRRPAGGHLHAAELRRRLRGRRRAAVAPALYYGRDDDGADAGRPQGPGHRIGPRQRHHGVPSDAAQGGEWTTPDVWHTDEVSVHMSDVVAVDGVIYGLSHLNRGQYFALDLDSGKVLWKGEPRRAEHAAIARAGRTLFSLEDDGELVVMRASRTGFEQVTRYEVATSATWAQPAISGSRIFVKDVSTLALWTLD